MAERRSWDGLEVAAYDRLLDGACCPAAGDALLAVAAEFRPVDAASVSFRLDELARALFGVAARREPRAASFALAELVTDELRLRGDETALDGLWLDAVLERRAGHPLALAVVAAEIGRRAGIAVGICSTPCGWYAGIGERDRLWLIDPVSNPGGTPSGPVRRHCGHEVAFAALTGIHARLLRDGEPAEAARAAALRARLPVARHG
jgi:hypothetical protein